MTPRLKSAEYIGGYKIEVSFTDGISGVIDLEGELWGEVLNRSKSLKHCSCRELVSAPVPQLIHTRM